MQSRVSSSEDEDDDDDDGAVDHKDGKRGKILASTFTTYADQTGEPGVSIATAGNICESVKFISLSLALSRLLSGGDVTGLARTGQFVSELFQSGALTCLICIASVKRTQAVRRRHTRTQTHTQTNKHTHTQRAAYSPVSEAEKMIDFPSGTCRDHLYI